ncbi:hypothetical protein D1007_54896 [Hordeum vulgare]|nr:hypothetical protein D1007_54896 [Hordeum vulgare]
MVGGGAAGTLVDPKDMLLAAFLYRSLMTKETGAQWLHRKNEKVLRFAIEMSECKATTEVEAKAKATRHAKEQGKADRPNMLQR